MSSYENSFMKRIYSKNMLNINYSYILSKFYQICLFIFLFSNSKCRFNLVALACYFIVYLMNGNCSVRIITISKYIGSYKSQCSCSFVETVY